jgi:hypothetical protein
MSEPDATSFGAANRLREIEDERAAEHAAHAAAATTIRGAILGAPATFTALATRDRWFAVADHDGATVVVGGAGAPPASLDLRALDPAEIRVD